MDLIDFEVDEVRKIAENVIPSSKLITCMRSLIRIDIRQTESRQITICIRFPVDYPKQHVLLELKSRSLSEKLRAGLTALAEQNAKEFLGKPQAMIVMKFIDNYLRENPLCIVFDEIAAIRTLLNRPDKTSGGELRCRQKTSSVILTARGGDYYFKAKIFVPTEYPSKCIYWDDHESNLPITLVRFLNGQAKEIARKCVEAPLRVDASKRPFQAQPSFRATLKFLIDATVDFHIELCPICKAKCLPSNADCIETNDTEDQYIERVYCGHLFHQECLKRYMREPPFPAGGKLCPARKLHPRSDKIETRGSSGGSSSSSSSKSKSNDSMCNIRLSHDRWGLSVKLAEARWAQQQARERELEEVKDFLQ